MRKLFENWNNYLNERGNPSERRFREAVVDFVIGQMQTMGMSAGEASDRARIQKEVHNIVDLAMEQLGLAQEAMYEPGRAVADIDTGEERMDPEDLMHDEVQDLADKFGVEASVKTASDGKPAIMVRHQSGEVVAYDDAEEMYQDLASRQEMSEAVDREIMIPGYGSMMISQVERKLAQMLQEAAEDAAKDPPQYSHLDGGVIQALHQALKDNKEQ